MKIFIETERLYLREILPTDIDGMYELDSDSEVHRYLGNEPVAEKGQLVEVINFIRQQYIDYGIGRWAVIDKGSNRFIGWAGLKFVTESINNHVSYYDIGYRLIRRYWGRGFATEATIALLDYAFKELGIREVYAFAESANGASDRVLRKAGFDCMERFILDGVEHNWYKRAAVCQNTVLPNSKEITNFAAIF